MPNGFLEPVLGYMRSFADQIAGLGGPMAPWVLGIIAVLFLFRSSGIVSRIWRAIEETMFSNWRLALLGATGLILSLASGWTTWDGMKNFTGEPILSAMVTFGVQGVMLIVAWLIGESFATGMSQQAPKSTIDGEAMRSDFGLKGAMMLALAGVLVAGFAALYYFSFHGARPDHAQISTVIGLVGAGLLTIGLLIVAARANTLRSYFDATRVIVRTSVLWVMFLACMATSVFFSFDSLFTAIFPQSERVRAAELRAQNQVAGIVADIGETISKKRLSEAESLFKGVDASGKDNGWTGYEKQLSLLADKSQGAERIIEDHYVAQMEKRRRGISEQQERITSATSGQAGLLSKKASLTDELARLETERPTLAADYAEKKNALDARAKEVDAKRVDAMAEEKGVEGTGKVGKGPVFRQRNEELSKLQDFIKIGEERVRDSKKRLDQTETRLAQIKRELAAVDGDLGKLKSEASTAEQRIKLAEDAKSTEEGVSRVDPARVRSAFESARNEFRQEPTAERLAKVQQMCGQLYNGLASAEVTKDRVRGIDCDPKAAVEAAARVFALNDGIKAFTANCQGGDKMSSLKSTDALFEFSRKCLADSGLPSRETDQMRTKINGIELARDDKAHRFVVTWNAFQDGNRLAYLALAIAVAIDSLVFMSGLFGANAVRSPLSDVPTMKARSAEQLEGIIEAALLPDIFTKARIARRAMQPAHAEDGFTHEVRLHELDPSTASNVRDVLNAGATIGAVRKGLDDGVYGVRSELYEFLSEVIKRELKNNKSDATQSLRLNELEDRIAEALIPDIGRGADIVLHYMHAANEKDGFSSIIEFNQVPDEYSRPVRGVLNVGARFGKVRRNLGDESRYEVHGDVHSALSSLRARILMSAAAAPQIGLGGQLKDHHVAVPAPGSAAAAIAPPRQPVRVSGAGSAGALSVEKAEKIKGTYWVELLSALGIDAVKVKKRLDGDGVEQAAKQLWAALERQAENNRRLKHALDAHRQAQDAALSQMYSSLRSAAANDPKKLELLEEIGQHVERLFDVLLLFPECELIGELIEALEQAAGADNGQLPGEQALLDLLRQVKWNMERMDLSDAREWQRISSAFADHAQNPQNVLIFQNAARNAR